MTVEAGGEYGMRSIQRLRLTAGFSLLPLLKAAVSIWCPTFRVTNKSTDQEPEGQLSPSWPSYWVENPGSHIKEC